MPTTEDYENAYLNLMEAFTTAMQGAVAEYPPTEQTNSAVLDAFDLATRYGWDPGDDEDWLVWASKATLPEIIANGLAIAIQKVSLPEKEVVRTWRPPRIRRYSRGGGP